MSSHISSIDGLLVRDSGSWIHRKYFFLKRYMYIFTQGMKTKWHHLTYIDLFAGPGRCLIRDTNSEVDGSPLIALGYEFSKYIFVEENADIDFRINNGYRSHYFHGKVEARMQDQRSRCEFLIL